MSYYDQNEKDGYAQHPGYNGHERGFDQKHGAQQYAGVPQYQQGPPMHEHQQSAIGEGSDTGDYLGISWTIKHRSSNSTISINLPSQGDTISSKAGAMVHMSSSIRMEGKVNFSMKKLFTGSQMIDVTYIGPSTVTLAPLMMGDIVTIPIDTAPPQKGRVSKNDAWSGWNIGKHCFLAASAGVERVTEAQGLKNAFFSGNDLWIYRLVGKGVAWITSFGAIEAIQLQTGEQHIVDHGHLVAWNCHYTMERAGQKTMTMAKTGEGMVARFMGPGTIYVQTRNIRHFAEWVREQAPSA